MDGIEPKRPGGRWKKIFLLQLIAWPAALLLADLGVRFATGYDGEATRTRMLEIVEAVTTGVPDPARDGEVGEMEVGDLALHPYTGFGPRGMLLTQNAELKRSSEDSPEGEYRILVLGGSVAAGFCNNQKSPGIANVRERLMSDPRFEGRTIRFIPAAFGSFKQPQQLNLANFLLASGVRPHAILNLDGFNEVALARENSAAGMHPAYPSYSRWIHLTSEWGTDSNKIIEALSEIAEARTACIQFAELALDWGVQHSSLLGPAALKELEERRMRHGLASRSYVRMITNRPGLGRLMGPSFEEDSDTVLRTAVQMWSESSRSLHASCEERGIFYLNVLQPTLHDTGAKIVTDKERERGKAVPEWIEAVRVGYPLLREEGERLREDGVHFFDASRAFADVDETLYFDACHFNRVGYIILGKLIGDAFLADLP